MIIELFDYGGQGIPRQVLANLPFILDNEKCECIVFFPEGKQMDFKFYTYEYSGEWAKFYLYANIDEYKKGVQK